jgi:putative flippase GtrA
MKPDRKVAAGGLAGALSIIVVWLMSLGGVDVPGEVAAAFTTILGFVTAYFVKNA